MAKKQIKASKPTKVKSPVVPKSEERKFAESMESMVSIMSRLWRSQVIGGLQAKTVDKFEDAQAGNFASILLGLSKKTNKALIKRFDDDRIDGVSKDILGKVNKQNQDGFYSSIEKAIGINQKQLIAEEGLKPRTNALILETSQWAKKLRDETLEMFTANTLRGMSLGMSLDEILAEFDDMVETRKGHAKFVARNQIQNFNSILTKTRAQNLGIQKAIWVTSHDERVRGNPGGKYPNARPSHFALDGVEFELSKGAPINGQHLLPGTPHNCRCTYELIIPEDD